MAGFELQRTNMVESQVRPSDIWDRRIIRAMQAVPRELFAAEDTRATAYCDEDLPVGNAAAGEPRRALLAPRVFAKLVQFLEIADNDRVLEVGSATGYAAAVLARIAKEVVALECDAALADRARRTLTELGAGNAKVVKGDLAQGAAADAPYAAILISGAINAPSPALLDQLCDGGRMTAIVFDGGVGRLVQWRRTGAQFDARPLAEGAGRPLPGLQARKVFEF
jgi:protein-L-isoaspartate(D-aspartate) O-methyltransferase